MYNISIYAGSFDPFHKGHLWVAEQAAACFDKVIIMIGTPPPTVGNFVPYDVRRDIIAGATQHLPNVDVPGGFLTDSLEIYATNCLHRHSRFEKDVSVSFIRGIRDTRDFVNEKNWQRIGFPNFFVLSDMAHISSTAIREGVMNWQSMVCPDTEDTIKRQYGL